MALVATRTLPARIMPAMLRGLHAAVPARIVATMLGRFRASVVTRIMPAMLRSLHTAMAARVVFFRRRGIWVHVRAVPARVMAPWRRTIRIAVSTTVVFAAHVLNNVPFFVSLSERPQRLPTSIASHFKFAPASSHRADHIGTSFGCLMHFGVARWHEYSHDHHAKQREPGTDQHRKP